MMARLETTQQSPASLFDSLYCSEEPWDAQGPELDVDDEDDDPTAFLADQDLSWEDEELARLASREEPNPLRRDLAADPCLAGARREAMGWMMKAHARNGFSALTAVLAVDYLDRFLSGFGPQAENPWTTQLTAVACLSLAAKVEETQVPFLLDLQGEESNYLFEAKTIQKMELLVLSTLQWKMNPVTPISFLDYFARRLGLKGHLCWEFLRRCEEVLLASLSDCRSTSYLASVMATAVVLHVINDLDPCLGLQCLDQLLPILGMQSDTVDECTKLVSELASAIRGHRSSKRKFGSVPGSPDGVVDAYFSSDSSNDSWALAESRSSSPEPLLKKSRAEDRLRPNSANVNSEILLFPH
ncbi:cyclin-D3-3 [Eucalyptus grandis]|uniref:cyclin-D3-3 n=1 Tax=Eucalyptus grandis TaxID=71139 RepID=UPI00192E906D|nr:cyclin-D3-3 [Eucalyptus grandis]